MTPNTAPIRVTCGSIHTPIEVGSSSLSVRSSTTLYSIDFHAFRDKSEVAAYMLNAGVTSGQKIMQTYFLTLNGIVEVVRIVFRTYDALMASGSP